MRASIRFAMAAASALLLTTHTSAMSSTNFRTEPIIVDNGGGERSSTNYKTDVSIGRSVAGYSSSTSFQTHIGLVLLAGDQDAPGAVTSFSVDAAGDTTIDLSWTNPVDADFAGVVVFRREGAAPTFVPVSGATYTAATAYGDATCIHAGPGTSVQDASLAASSGAIASMQRYASWAIGGWKVRPMSQGK